MLQIFHEERHPDVKHTSTRHQLKHKFHKFAGNSIWPSFYKINYQDSDEVTSSREFSIFCDKSRCNSLIQNTTTSVFSYTSKYQ